MSGFEILIVLLTFTAVMLFILGVFFFLGYQKERWRLNKRVKQIGGVIRSEELTDVFYKLKDQVVKVVGSLGKLVKPKGEGGESELRKSLSRAGYRRESASTIFLGLKAFFAIVFLGVSVLLKIGILKSISSFHFILLSIVLTYIGFYLPNLWLRMKIARREEKILEGFPDALDLMVVCVEAGIGLDAAISRVGEEMSLSNRVLAEEFRLLSLELRAGKQRRDALRNLAMRTGLEDVSSLVSLLIQTDKFGTSVAQALRVHSESMRMKRYQKAEELATKLPVKLIFPLIIFIFPSIFVTVLGPAIIQVFKVLLPRLAGR
ncbi:MAG: type II secretion system F family protein [Thermodesulfobacteriota bacterium]